MAIRQHFLKRLQRMDLWCRILTTTFADRLYQKLFTREPKKTAVIEGDIQPGFGEELCIFAHFDKDDLIDDYVINYLEQLHGLGLEIILVSVSRDLDSRSIAKARRFCQSILVRENVGYDFASWKSGLEHAGDLSRYRALLLANDSVYGPIRDLKDVFTLMRRRGLDVWSITDSIEIRQHLQSYFLVFEKAVLESTVFHEFWAKLPIYGAKLSVIWNCEVGISRRLRREGFELGALCEYTKLKEKYPDAFQEAESRSLAERPVNLTLYFWKTLVQEYNCPFIKVALLRDNPEKVDDLSEWPEVLSQSSSYDLDMIRRHLARTTVGR